MGRDCDGQRETLDNNLLLTRHRSRELVLRDELATPVDLTGRFAYSGRLSYWPRRFSAPSLAQECVELTKNARYSSVAFSSTSAYAEPNNAMSTLTKIIVARKFHE